jgi:hypothetical protein
MPLGHLFKYSTCGTIEIWILFAPVTKGGKFRCHYFGNGSDGNDSVTLMVVSKVSILWYNSGWMDAVGACSIPGQCQKAGWNAGA